MKDEASDRKSDRNECYTVGVREIDSSLVLHWEKKSCWLLNC